MPGIDPLQIILIVVVTSLTIVLVFVGIQVIYILREMRESLKKVNRSLDDMNLISDSVAKPIAGVSGFLMGIKSGAKLMRFLREDKKEEK